MTTTISAELRKVLDRIDAIAVEGTKLTAAIRANVRKGMLISDVEKLTATYQAKMTALHQELSKLHKTRLKLERTRSERN